MARPGAPSKRTLAAWVAIAHVLAAACVAPRSRLSYLMYSYIDIVCDSPPSEKTTKVAQKLGQLQLFIAVSPQECMGQLASSGPT